MSPAQIASDYASPSAANTVRDSLQPFGDGLTFAQRYCALRGLPREAYVESMLRECLYPSGRRLMRFLPRRFFSADRTFIESVGRLHRRREFHNLMLEFVEDPDNSGWWREVFRLRVSVRRVHDIVWQAAKTTLSDEH